MLDCLAFKLTKLRLRRLIYLMNFQNRLLICIGNEAGGVVSTTPEGMGHHILLCSYSTNYKHT